MLVVWLPEKKANVKLFRPDPDVMFHVEMFCPILKTSNHPQITYVQAKLERRETILIRVDKSVFLLEKTLTVKNQAQLFS